MYSQNYGRIICENGVRSELTPRILTNFTEKKIMAHSK